MSHQDDPARRRRLRWRARRGLLENDILVTRYLDRYETSMSDDDVSALTALFELGDNDLMDLILARKDPEGELDTHQVRSVLGRLREE